MMRSVLLKISLALPMFSVAAQGFSGEPAPPSEEAPVGIKQPSAQQTEQIQSLLEKSAALIVRVPLNEAMQQMKDSSELRVVLGKGLAATDTFDAMKVWDEAESGAEILALGSDESPRFGSLYPYFRWSRYGRPDFSDYSYYCNHYPYFLGNPYTYYYDSLHHHGRFGDYDYYYYNRRW